MKEIKEKISEKKERLRSRIRQRSLAALGNYEGTFLMILAVVIGFLSGLGSVGFKMLIRLVKTGFWAHWGGYSGYVPGDITTLLVPLAPFIGGLLVGPISVLFPAEAEGDGVPEVLEAVVLKGGVLKLRTVFIRAFASAICLGSGGSAGREGPIAQIGSAIGSSFGQLFRMSANNVRTLLGCGAAGGIAATFNAPIAGVLFALEIVLGEWNIATFSPVIMASVIATATERYIEGNIPAFNVPIYELVNPVEIIFYIILGLLAGLTALLFIQSLNFFKETFENRVKVPNWTKPAIGGLLLGLICLFFPQLFGNGYNPMGQALMGNMALGLMVVLLFLKILATSLTLGSGSSGGLFAPSLYIGAMLGGSFGTLVHYLFPTLTATKGAYALVGMGATFAAAAHAPMTNILILFEITGNYQIILPIMASCIVSTLVIKHFSPHSIYTIRLHQRGITIEAGKEVNVLQSLKVRDAMSTEMEIIAEDMPFDKILMHMTRSTYSNFPIVNRNKELTGILSFQDLRKHVFEPDLEKVVVAKDIATLHVTTVIPSDSLKDALAKLSYRNVEQLPVVDAMNPKKLLGILTRRDIITTYNKAIFRYETSS
ncbi:MAG: chloride channel protein [Deltaproteobacteria bacterium]|nr:chloride channel protein [Deltaproteobacteria bacterium]